MPHRPPPRPRAPPDAVPPTSGPDRAAAFHRRALDRASVSTSAEAVEPADGAAPRAAGRVGRTLPGAEALAIGLVGLVLGLSATALVLARGWDPGAVSIGPWRTQLQVGTTAIDPYARAELARSGDVPMAANEGLVFRATTDETGYRLLRTCRYRIGGDVPAARFWTLTATGADGRISDDPARRSAFTSTEVVRDLDGRFTIEIAPMARPGNWLPLSGEGPLTLTLRLYDAPMSGDPGEVASASLPSIARLACGPAAGTVR